MMRSTLALFALLVCTVPGWADEDNPHRITDPDNDTSCDFCHDEDLELVDTPLETCLTCHGLDEHAGAREHVRATPAEVARLQAPADGDDEPALPLMEDGTIWCGTCHLFHDPEVNEELPLPSGWLPAKRGLPGTVADAVAGSWTRLARKYDQPPPVARFATQGNTWLRLPVSDGSLCTQCHRGMGK